MKPAPSPAETPPLPVHVAIIMDGNGRWARSRGLPRVAGHRQGAEAVREVIEGAVELGVRYLTLYGFSNENWNRPQGEVTDLMGLLRLYLRQEVADLARKGVRIGFIGDRGRLAGDIVDLMEGAERKTAANTRLNLTVALSYGGRQEIVAAARHIAEQAACGSLDPAALDETGFERFLTTAGTPDPDLVIRTSGEMRISNFLLWQSAYAELVFVDKLWPDFSRADLADAIREFQRRERRYGTTGA